MTDKMIGRYKIVRVLGHIEMGMIYEACDPIQNRPLALRTFQEARPGPAIAPERSIAFQRQARSMAWLLHPNIVPLLDHDVDRDIAFVVVQFIEGRRLRSRLTDSEPVSVNEAVQITLEILSALDHLHRAGIVHRNVKPANVLLDERGRARLTEYSSTVLADLLGISSIGALRNMSPEQAAGQQIDHRSDLFSTGVVLYELLTGIRPFDADNQFAILNRILNSLPAPPSYHNKKLPRSLDLVLARAMAKNRDERFTNAGDFAVALRGAV